MKPTSDEVKRIAMECGIPEQDIDGLIEHHGEAFERLVSAIGERYSKTLRLIASELLDYVISDIIDGDHSGSDDPNDYELVTRAKDILMPVRAQQPSERT